MKISGSRVNNFLAAPPETINGVLFFGPDRGLVHERVHTLAQYYGGDLKDAFSTTVLTADELQKDPVRLHDEMAALSLLGDQRLVRVRLDHERPAAGLAQTVGHYDTYPDMCVVKLIVEAGNLLPRSSVRKAFEGARHFAALGCYPASATDIAEFVRTTLSANKISIDQDALAFWQPLLEGDQALLRNEVEKMLLYKGYGTQAESRVSLQDVRALASAGQLLSIDDVVFHAMSGNCEACDQAYQLLIARKISPAAILRRLQYHLMRLLEIQAHVSAGRKVNMAMAQLRPPIFKLHEMQVSQQVKIWPNKNLSQVLSRTIEIEQSMKQAGAAMEAVLGQFLYNLSDFIVKRKQYA